MQVEPPAQANGFSVALQPLLQPMRTTALSPLPLAPGAAVLVCDSLAAHGAQPSLDSHPGVSAAEHRGTFSAPRECVTVYRGERFVVGDVGTGDASLVGHFVDHGSLDSHKVTADGMTMSTCGNGLSP